MLEVYSRLRCAGPSQRPREKRSAQTDNRGRARRQPRDLRRPCVHAGLRAQGFELGREREPAVRSVVENVTEEQLHIVTDGEKGLSVRLGTSRRDLPSFATTPQDTAGAGDWTTAAFLYSLPRLRLEELSLEAIVDSLRFAQAVAALSCLFVGARGMNLAWKQRRVMRVARELAAERMKEIQPRYPAAGSWTTEVERLCPSS